jgi:hypothetical protein
MFDSDVRYANFLSFFAEELILRNTNVNGAIPIEIAEASSLKILDLASSHVEGPLPSLVGLGQLTLIDFQNTDLSGTIPDDWGNLGQLEFLFMKDVSALSGPLPNSLGGLTNLKNFTCSSTKISGTIPESIGKMVSLGKYTL